MVFFILIKQILHINQCVSSSESHMPQSLDQFCSLYKCCPCDICLMVLMGSPSTAVQMTHTLMLFCRASPASVNASLSSLHGFKLPSSQTEVVLFGSVPLRRSVSTSSPSPVTSNHLLKIILSLTCQRSPSLVSFTSEILQRSNLYCDSIIWNFEFILSPAWLL